MNGKKDTPISITDMLEFIRLTIEKVSFGVFVLDRSGKILFCNDPCARIFVYDSKEEIKGTSLWDLLESNETDSVRKLVTETGHFMGERKAITRDQKRILIRVTFVDMPMIDIILGFLTDITKRRKWEDRLRESEAKYRALVDTIQEGLVIVDPEENIVFVNPAFCKALSYSKAELVGLNLAKLTSPKEFELIKKESEERKRGITGLYELKMLTKNGQEKAFLISASPLYDSNSSYAGAIAVHVDLSKKHLQTARELEDRSIFLKMMVTEISEQLLLAKGWLDIVTEETSNPEQKNRVEKAFQNLRKIDQLSKQADFLIGSKLEYTLLNESIESFFSRLNERLRPIISLKRCHFEMNQLIDDSESYKCPRVLEYAIEQIIRDSLSRRSQSIEINTLLTPDKQIQIVIIDDGKSFFDSDEKSKLELLSGFYLADVLLRQIKGALEVKYVLPGEGTRISLTFPC